METNEPFFFSSSSSGLLFLSKIIISLGFCQFISIHTGEYILVTPFDSLRAHSDHTIILIFLFVFAISLLSANFAYLLLVAMDANRYDK